MSVFYIAGEGGSGKSLVAFSLMHYSIVNGQEPMLVETDMEKTDVGSAYVKNNQGKNCKFLYIRLKSYWHWRTMINNIMEFQRNNINNNIIINTPALTSVDIEYYYNFFNTSDIKDFRIIWTLGVQQYGAKLLKKFRSLVAKPPICIVQCGKLGMKNNFFFIKDEGLEDLPSVYFPALGETITMAFQSLRYAPHEVLDTQLMSEKDKGIMDRQIKIMLAIAEEIVKKSYHQKPDFGFKLLKMGA